MSTPRTAALGLCDLFERDEISNFIEETASANMVSILAGAGTSIESGFPDWNSLVSRLLKCVAAEQGLSSSAADEFASWTTRREGLTAAAAVAKACLRDDFSEHLHRALYDQQRTPPAGQSALAIARLVESFGPASCNVVTTNYDLVLDNAIAAIMKAVPAASARARKPKGRYVTHLHGVVTPRGRIRGELVLSERDYFLMQEDSAWQQAHFADRFAESTCVFVGASLTDPNLLRYLYRSESTKRHYAIFVRQQDADIYAESAQEIIALREKTSEARWKNAGIQPLHTDFYSQSAQLLNEVVHRRKTTTQRRVYQPLPKRLVRWRNKLDEGVLTTQLSPFRSIQEYLQEVMHELLEGIRVNLVDSGHRPQKDEGLGMNMWVYDPRSESLTNWASADRVWRDPKTMEPLLIDWTSEFISIQAFCAGSLVSQSTGRYVASRWNYVIGAPLYVESETTGRLPVGAVTIASTLDSNQSVLRRGLKTLRRVSLPTVETALAEVLQ